MVHNFISILGIYYYAYDELIQYYDILFFNENILFILGGQLYSGTVSDFSGSDALIFRGNLRTEQYDLKHLNGKSIRIKISITFWVRRRYYLKLMIEYFMP